MGRASGNVAGVAPGRWLGDVPRSTPLGLRLARLEPIAGSEAARRRAGVVVAEAALSTAAGPGQSVSAVEVQTPLAPVLLGPSAGASSDPAAVELAVPDGTILGTARVAPADVDEARARWWGRVAGVLWLIAAIGLTLGTGPLADWRALSRTLTTYLAVTTLAAVVLIAAWVCVDWSLDSARLAEHDEVRFLATTLLEAALVWLAWTTVARWRLARRAGRSGAGAAPWRLRAARAGRRRPRRRGRALRRYRLRTPCRCRRSRATILR